MLSSVLQKVHENDVITAVNGLRGDAKAMLEEVFAFQKLRLALCKDAISLKLQNAKWQSRKGA